MGQGTERAGRFSHGDAGGNRFRWSAVAVMNAAAWGISLHVSVEHSDPVEMPSIFVLNFFTILSVFFLFGKVNPR
jgi:hypothetical protein